jgi:hypothetical protein
MPQLPSCSFILYQTMRHLSDAPSDRRIGKRHLALLKTKHAVAIAD